MTGLMRTLWERASGSESRRGSSSSRPPPTPSQPPPSPSFLWSEESAGLDGFRLLVFRDSTEWGDRRLLYDSATVRPRRSSENASEGEGSGSPANSPRQAPPPRHPISADGKFEMDCSSDSDSQYSTVNSLSGLFPGGGSRASVPVDVPERLYRHSLTIHPPDEASLRPPSSPSPSRSASAIALSRPTSPPVVGSPISRSLRLRTAHTFSLDYGISQLRQRSRNSDSLSEASLQGRRAPSMLGICLLLPGPGTAAASWRHFLLTHISLLQAEIARLQTAIQNAHALKSGFYNRVYTAWCEFRGSLWGLYKGARLREPVWQSLRHYAEASMSEDNAAATLATRFTTTFRRIATAFDNKDHNFFLSNLITGVLMEHQTWVGSVCPSSSSRPFLRRLSAATRAAHATSSRSPQPPSPSPTPEITIRTGDDSDDDGASTVSSLAYNPLVAQYSEVRGRVGSGSSANGEARVLVVGNNAALVTEFLFLLSYFIRSSEVRLKRDEHLDLPSNKTLADDFFSSLPIPPCHESPCCDFTGNVDAVSISCDAADKPRTPPSLGTLFSSPFASPIPHRSAEKGERKRGRVRSPLPEELTDSGAVEPKGAPAVIKINNRRFEVTPICESDDLDQRPRSSSFRRPSSPRKNVRKTNLQIAASEPSRFSTTLAPEPVTRIPVIAVPMDDDNVPKLRKVSDSYIHAAEDYQLPPSPVRSPSSPPPARASTGVQLSPRSPDTGSGRPCPAASPAEAETGGDSSGQETDVECRSGKEKRLPPCPPRSLDSGIAEADAIGLLDSVNTDSHHHHHHHQSHSCTGGRPDLSREEAASVRLHESIFGDDTELEELRASAAQQAESESIQPLPDSPTSELYHSLLGGFLPRFSPHFALSGCPATLDILSVVQEDVNVRSDGVEEGSVCVVGNADEWEVRLVSRSGMRPCTVPSQIVLRMVESVVTMSELGSSPHYLLGLVEEGLREVWAKSVALASALDCSVRPPSKAPDSPADESPDGEWVEMAEVLRLSGVDWADLPLLFATAGLHSSHLIRSLSL